MKIEAEGIIYDATGRPEKERVAFFTSLFIARSGSIFAGYHLGSAKQAFDSTLRLSRSRDGGRTWSEVGFRFETAFEGRPGSLCNGELVEVAPGRLLLAATWIDRADPARPLFDPATKSVLPKKLLLAFSEDDGDHWTPWRQLPLDNFNAPAGCGPILQWSDGRIAYPVEGFQDNTQTAPGNHGAWLIFSSDGGLTFAPPQLVARDPNRQTYYWDQRLCAGPKPGQFVASFWTHDLVGKQDLNVHFCRAEPDGKGFHCGPITATPIPGQVAAPFWREDKGLLIFAVDRHRPGTMTLWSSPDWGKTWPEHLVVYTHEERAAITQGSQNIDFAKFWEDMRKWSFGHPAIRPLRDGRLLLAFYAGTPTNMSLRWARVSLG